MIMTLVVPKPDLINLVHDGRESVLTLLGREVVELLGLVAQERLVVVVIVVFAHVVLVFVMTAKIMEYIKPNNLFQSDHQGWGVRSILDTVSEDTAHSSILLIICI